MKAKKRKIPLYLENIHPIQLTINQSVPKYKNTVAVSLQPDWICSTILKKMDGTIEELLLISIRRNQEDIFRHHDFSDLLEKFLNFLRENRERGIRDWGTTTYSRFSPKPSPYGATAFRILIYY